MKPFLIINRLTIEAELAIFGHDRANVCIVSQEKAFMTHCLFELWGREVFFPTLEDRRRQFNYRGRALLLMDGLGAHHTQRFLDECKERDVDVLFLLPHSSDQTQPLDLVTFGSLTKRFANGSKCRFFQTRQANLVCRILGAWCASSTPHLNVTAFMSVGLVPFQRDGEYYLDVQPEEARRVRQSLAASEEAPTGPVSTQTGRRVRVPTRHE
jgi:hypothetical protein